ncbi:MAG: MFS transporter [Oscillospiraceae bacterium]|nr:MFS transporter [Oscillospiraceae bacterium]
MNLKRKTNLQYAASSGLFWAFYCPAAAFCTVYMRSRGYSGADAGFVMAAASAVSMALQTPLASFADRAKRVTVAGIFACLCAVIIALAALMPALSGGGALLPIAYAAMLSCAVSCQSISNSLYLLLERRGVAVNYGVGRGTGSLGYAVMAALLGSAVTVLGSETVPASIALFAAAELALLLVISHRNTRLGIVGSAGRQSAQESVGVREFVVRNRRFCAVLIGIVLVYFPHILLANFLIYPVENAGGDSAVMGRLAAWTAVLELPVMFMFDRLCRRFGARRLLALAGAALTVKTAAFALASSIPALFAAGLLQMASFALLIPASVRWASETVSIADEVKGQSFVTVSMTLATFVASLAGGVMYERLGSPATLGITAIISAVGSVIILTFIFGKKKTAAGAENLR